MKVWPRRATGRTADANGVSRIDSLSFLYPNLRKMTIADGVITMTHDDVIAGSGVIAYIRNVTVKHGKDFLIMSFQVQATVLFFLAGEWIFTNTERRIDFDTL